MVNDMRYGASIRIDTLGCEPNLNNIALFQGKKSTGTAQRFPFFATICRGLSQSQLTEQRRVSLNPANPMAM
jgi:hypothetical protein